LSRPETTGDITAVLSWKDRVFAAWESGKTGTKIGVSVFKRGKKIDELEIPEGHRQPISQILIFGSWIVACCSNELLVWKSANYEYYTAITPPRSGFAKSGKSLSGVICNMPTFLNKVFVGRQDGSVEIWNLRTGFVASSPPSL
jgi:U3 small nucleolar RNA-associated protein 21